MTSDPLKDLKAREALRAREKAENERAIATARREGKNVTFIAHDGCEVTVTPGGHVFHNVWSRNTRRSMTVSVRHPTRRDR